MTAIASLASGDARTALNILELASQTAMPGEQISVASVQRAAQRQLLYDKGGGHYNIISALHSLSKFRRRRVPPARPVLEAGRPLYVARRLVHFASEDIRLSTIGIADRSTQRKPSNSLVCPGKLALAQCVVYLAAAQNRTRSTPPTAPRRRCAQNRNDPVPLRIRNAPTGLMKVSATAKVISTPTMLRARSPTWTAFLTP